MNKITTKLFYIFLFLILVINITSCGNNDNPPDISDEVDKVTLFLYRGNDFLEEREVEVGSKIDFIYDDPDYTFFGWYDEKGEVCYDGCTVEDEMWMYAKTIKKGTKYMITYHMNDEADFDTVRIPGTYLYGTKTVLIDPVRPLKYRFNGWYDNPELEGERITEISEDTYGNVDLWDSWIDENIYHNITYVVEDTNVYSETPLEKVMEGVEYTMPYPIRENYYFRGWYTDPGYKNRVYKVEKENTSDCVFYAKFAYKNPTDTYLSIAGDSISTYHGTIPPDAGAYYPTFVNFPLENTYFMRVCNTMCYNLLKNNSYSGSRLSGELFSEGQTLPAGNSDKRVQGLSDEEHDPDILIVHLGTNEYSQGVSVVTFKSAIVKYIKKLRALYDDVEIYFCLHPYNGYGPGYVAKREEYNQAILSYAEKYNFKTIDLTKCWGKEDYAQYIYSNAHPNEKGFERMAEVIIEELKKYHNNKY